MTKNANTKFFNKKLFNPLFYQIYKSDFDFLADYKTIYYLELIETSWAEFKKIYESCFVNNFEKIDNYSEYQNYVLYKNVIKIINTMFPFIEDVYRMDYFHLVKDYRLLLSFVKQFKFLTIMAILCIDCKESSAKRLLSKNIEIPSYTAIY